MLNVNKVRSRTDYVDEVYRVLLDAISDGSLAPGTRITQEELAEQLNLSRSPVLQAMRLLKKDGLLQDAPGRGLEVARLDGSRVSDLYQVRGALDSLAARLAAQRKASIDDALIAAGRKAARGDDVKAMIDADSAFHRAIYEASGNQLIGENAMVHWIHLRRVMGEVLRHSALRATIWDEHQAIAAAIRAGDVRLAGELSDRHAAAASANLVGLMGGSS